MKEELREKSNLSTTSARTPLQPRYDGSEGSATKKAEIVNQTISALSNEVNGEKGG